MANRKWSDEKLLNEHDEECVLADTIYDMMFNGWDDTPKIGDRSQPATTESQPATLTTHKNPPKLSLKTLCLGLRDYLDLTMAIN